jgi:hypothetical protein
MTTLRLYAHPFASYCQKVLSHCDLRAGALWFQSRRRHTDDELLARGFDRFARYDALVWDDVVVCSHAAVLRGSRLAPQRKMSRPPTRKSVSS